MNTRYTAGVANVDPIPTRSVLNRADQLARHSTPYQDPAARIDWGSLTRQSFWLPEEALSLHGISEFDRLPLAERQRLSHYEFAHFLEAGLWLEGIFLERLSKSVADARRPLGARIYELHELREETGHSLMFLDFLRRSGLASHENRQRPDRLLTWLGRHLPFDSTLFWAAIMLGEDIPDRLNRYVRAHPDGVCPVPIQLCVLHSADEARHITYGREILHERLTRMSAPARLALATGVHLLIKRFVPIFYYPPDHLYRRAGFTSVPWIRLARTNPTRRAFIARSLQPTLARLQALGLPLYWP